MYLFNSRTDRRWLESLGAHVGVVWVLHDNQGYVYFKPIRRIAMPVSARLNNLLAWFAMSEAATVVVVALASVACEVPLRDEWMRKALLPTSTHATTISERQRRPDIIQKGLCRYATYLEELKSLN